MLSGVLALVSILAACGDSDGDSEADATPTTTAAPATEDGSEPFTGDADSEWCDQARDVDARFDQSEELTSFDPATLEELYTGLSTALSEATEIAPSEIRTDVTNIASSIERLVEVLEGADWDLTQLSAEDAAVLDDPALVESAERIEKYGVEVCGLEADAPAEAPSGAESEQAVVDALMGLGLTEEEARCLAESLLSGGGSVEDLLSDPLALADQCGISFEDLSGLMGG